MERETGSFRRWTCMQVNQRAGRGCAEGYAGRLKNPVPGLYCVCKILSLSGVFPKKEKPTWMDGGVSV